jgi:microsomal dipeptidase-like Zn-dependent dipeptidase
VGEAIRARYDVIVGSVFDQYMFPNPENPDAGARWEKMLDLVEMYREMEGGVGLNLIRRKNDFRDSGNLVLGLEAGAHLINSLVDVKKLESHGIKIFGFQYNKDTPLATRDGLTKLGQEAAQYLFQRNLIIDLAHAGYKTRQDIMNIAEDSGKGGLVSYTHGSAEEDITDAWKNKMGERALKKAEIERLVKMGGIIGLGVTEPFFSGTRKLAERINDTLQLENGLERVAIGTDFGGVPPMFLTEIRTPNDFKILADILSEEFNLSDENINKILRQNSREWIEKAIE